MEIADRHTKWFISIITKIYSEAMQHGYEHGYEDGFKDGREKK